MNIRGRKNIIFLFVLIPFVVFCVITSIITPAFEAPDENHHLDYINYFSSNLLLPNQSNKNTKVEGEGHQNPLYYVLTGTIVRIFDQNNRIDFQLSPNYNHIWNGGTESRDLVFDHSQLIFSDHNEVLFHILRGLSIFFSAITLIFLFETTLLFTQNLNISLIAVLLISTLPQFVFISSVINNDSLAIMFITMSFYFLLKYLKNGRRGKNNLNIAVFILVLGFYTKLYSAGLILVFLMFLLIDERELKLSQGNIKQVIFVLLTIVILISPWFIRNLEIYNSVVGSQSYIYGNKTIFDLTISDIFSQIMFFGTSFIGRFGWGNILLYLSHYAFYLLIVSVLVYLVLSNNINRDRIYVNLSFTGILVVFLQIVYYGTIDLQFQGRYMFPAFVFIVIINAISLKSITNSFYIMQKISVFFGIVLLLYFQNIVAIVTLWFGYN